MPWTVEYLNATAKQLRRLDFKVRRRMLDFMQERVAGDADPYAVGDPLSGEWRGYWRYRVGDYRVICLIDAGKLLVLVVKAGHRSEIYNR